jgi:hypothetical protein
LSSYRKIDVVVLHLGETLVAESRPWSVEAERVGVSRPE